MKTSHIIILIVMATMMAMVLMAGCEEEPAEPNEVNEPFVSSLEAEVGIELAWATEPVVAIALYDFNTSVTNPFTFIIDGAEKQFTHEEFKRRLGFINEPNKPAEPNEPTYWDSLSDLERESFMKYQ